MPTAAEIKAFINTNIRAKTIANSIVPDTVADELDRLVDFVVQESPDVVIQTLTDGATITMNVANGKWGKVTLGGNRTFAFTNLTAGDAGLIFVTQDGTGGRTLSWPGNSDVPTDGLGLSAAAGETTIIGYVYDGTTIWLSKENYGVAVSGPTQLATPTLTATAVSSTQIDLSWTNVANESSYRLEWSANGTSGWTQIGGTIPANDLGYSHNGLTPGTTYYYRLKAVGDGVTFTDSAYDTDNAATSGADTSSPIRTSMTVENATPAEIWISYNENIDPGSVPATTAFAASGGRTVTAVNIGASSNVVRVTVNTPYTSGDTITLAYTVPGTNPIQDVAGNDAAGFTATSVVNNIAASYQTETNTYIAAVEGAGRTLTGTEKGKIDALVVAMKSIGWSKFKAAYIPVWGSAAANKFNLVNPVDSNAAFRLTYAGSGVTHAADGMDFNGTSGFADTNLIPANEFAAVTDMHLSFRTNESQNTNVFTCGTLGSGIGMHMKINDGANFVSNCGGGVNTSLASATQTGFFLVTRTTDGQNYPYVGTTLLGNSVSRASANGTLANLNDSILWGGASQSGVNYPQAVVKMQWGSAGAHLTGGEVTTLKNALDTFFS